MNPFQTWQDAGIDAILYHLFTTRHSRGFWAETILHTNMNYFMDPYMPYVFDTYQSSELKTFKIKNVITPFRKCKMPPIPPIRNQYRHTLLCASNTKYFVGLV